MSNINKINLNGVEYNIEDATTHRSDISAGLNISSYTDANPYICPSDGYFVVQPNANATNDATGYVNGAALLYVRTETEGYPPVESLYVRKGMRLFGTGTNAILQFRQIGY